MAIYDPHFGGYRIFVGDLGRQATRYDIEQEYERYGKLLDVWVARFVQQKSTYHHSFIHLLIIIYLL